MELNTVFEIQRNHFLSNQTKSYEHRITMLNKLKEAVFQYQNDLLNAINKDLGKSPHEAYMTEIGIVYKEISYFKKHLKKLMRNEKVNTPITDFPSKSYIVNEPYGLVTIISPWNYPINLALVPMVGALASGNTIILKPSELSVNTSVVLDKMISDHFESKDIFVLLGGIPETTKLLELKSDFIFFTGSTNVGKIVMREASKHLTPVCLELGGKSPVILDKGTNVSLAAKRIAFGKLLNSGQTCIAPDYILAHKDVKQEFIEEYMKQANLFYYKSLNNKDYCRIINKKHFDRILSYLEDDMTVIGLSVDEHNYKISPVVVDNPRLSSQLMTEEIFGPILPVIEVESVDEAINIVNDKPKPLALYLFTNDKMIEKKVLSSCSFGGGCINDTISHIANDHLPFGGVGNSGLNAYHGKYSYRLFTYQKSVLKKSTLFDLSIRYAPYTTRKEKVIRKFLK
jgi:aldehyde dehydrogenase (NAD+)